MKLYFIQAEDAESREAVFVGTQAELTKARAAYRRAGYAAKDISALEINVPTDKPGLLAFLNDLRGVVTYALAEETQLK